VNQARSGKAVVPGHISGIVLLGLFRGKGTPGMFDPVL
jgi:hypothetical protein